MRVVLAALILLILAALAVGFVLWQPRGGGTSGPPAAGSGDRLSPGDPPRDPEAIAGAPVDRVEGHPPADPIAAAASSTGSLPLPPVQVVPRDSLTSEQRARVGTFHLAVLCEDGDLVTLTIDGRPLEPPLSTGELELALELTRLQKLLWSSPASGELAALTQRIRTLERELAQRGHDGVKLERHSP